RGAAVKLQIEVIPRRAARLFRADALSRVDFVDEAALIETANDTAVDDVLDLDFADFRAAQRHQPLHVAQSLGRRVGFAIHRAMQVGVAFFRRGGIGAQPAYERPDHGGLVFRRERESDRFGLRLQQILHHVRALLQEFPLHDDRLAGEQLLQLGIFAQNVEALLFEAPAEDAVEHGGVDGAVLQRLHLNALIADHLKLNPVALLVKTEVLEPEHDAHPDRAADAGDAEAFAAQI